MGCQNRCGRDIVDAMDPVYSTLVWLDSCCLGAGFPSSHLLFIDVDFMVVCFCWVHQIPGITYPDDLC